jgi:hypothetical protein
MSIKDTRQKLPYSADKAECHPRAVNGVRSAQSLFSVSAVASQLCQGSAPLLFMLFYANLRPRIEI